MSKSTETIQIFKSVEWISSKHFFKNLTHEIKNFQATKIGEKACSLHHSLELYTDGFTTFLITGLGYLKIDFTKNVLYLEDEERTRKFEVIIVDKTLKEIFSELQANLKQLGWYSIVCL